MSPRLAFDWRISDVVPIVVGTKVTVRRVTSLIKCGHTWDGIMRIHPELCEEDVRACVLHALGVDIVHTD